MTTDSLPADFQSVAPTLQTIREGYRAIATIKTPEQFTSAGELLKAVKGAIKQIEDQRVAITKPINESLRAVNAQAKEAAEPFLKAETAIKGAMVTYSDEQERIRREEQRRVEAAAAAERARLAALQREEERKAREKAEALRREQEEAARRAREAEAAGRAEEARKAAAEAAKLAAQAVKVEEKSADKIETLQLREAMVVAPVVEREAPKVAGVSTREVWRFEVLDAAQVPRQYLAVDEAKIRKVVQALKADAQIPGVRVWSERQLAAGAA